MLLNEFIPQHSCEVYRYTTSVSLSFRLSKCLSFSNLLLLPLPSVFFCSTASPSFNVSQGVVWLDWIFFSPQSFREYRMFLPPAQSVSTRRRAELLYPDWIEKEDSQSLYAGSAEVLQHEHWSATWGTLFGIRTIKDQNWIHMHHDGFCITSRWLWFCKLSIRIQHFFVDFWFHLYICQSAFSFPE